METTCGQDTAVILKQDTRGRVCAPREHREAVLDVFERSGMSGAAFARLHGIKYATLMGWKAARQRRGADERQAPHPLFTEAVIEPKCATTEDGLWIELGGRARVRVTSPAQLELAAALIDAVGQRGRAC